MNAHEPMFDRDGEECRFCGKSWHLIKPGEDCPRRPVNRVTRPVCPHCGTVRPLQERSSAYWGWIGKQSADPTCWKFTKREEAIAFAAFIAGWWLRTGQDPDTQEEAR